MNDIKIKGAKVLVLGISFKENCPDIRKTKVVDLITELKQYGTNHTINDHWVSPEAVENEYKLDITNILPTIKFDTVVLAVSHKEFLIMDLHVLKVDKTVVYDVKEILENANGKLKIQKLFPYKNNFKLI